VTKTHLAYASLARVRLSLNVVIDYPQIAVVNIFNDAHSSDFIVKLTKKIVVQKLI